MFIDNSFINRHMKVETPSCFMSNTFEYSVVNSSRAIFRELSFSLINSSTIFKWLYHIKKVCSLLNKDRDHCSIIYRVSAEKRLFSLLSDACPLFWYACCPHLYCESFFSICVYTHLSPFHFLDSSRPLSSPSQQLTLKK